MYVLYEANANSRVGGNRTELARSESRLELETRKRHEDQADEAIFVYSMVRWIERVDNAVRI